MYIVLRFWHKCNKMQLTSQLRDPKKYFRAFGSSNKVILKVPLDS